ncbi:MAG: acyltransferase family protein [Anaerolineae bacterium]|nr:acyltransferase family protein [Anaerolineae bacterium]
MTQIGMQSAERTTAIAAKKERAGRLFYIDNIRSALIILVVLHHVALVYGASIEGYYYVEPPFTDPLAFQALLIFALVNQAWFMGAFFLFAGYFTPGSFDRKGVGPFLRDRLIRLGIPMLVFYFILSPISFLGYFLMPAQLTGITEPLTWQMFWQAYPDLVGLGPLWFVAMLLIFDFGYAAWRAVTANRTSSPAAKSSVPGYLSLAIFVLLLAGISYVMRIVVPLGTTVLEFPTLAYLPQYLTFFIVGIVAARRDWLRTLPNAMGVVGFAMAIVAIVVLFPLAFSGEIFSLEVTPALDNAMGNGHWQSAAYALWDSIFAIGMIMGLIVFFRRFIAGAGSFGRFLSQQSYTVYIIHIPIIVFVVYALRDVALGGLLKFGLASIIVLPLCFAAAYLIRKLPYATRVL